VKPWEWLSEWRRYDWEGQGRGSSGVRKRQDHKERQDKKQQRSRMKGKAGKRRRESTHRRD
jgi:hypothetical protein